MARGINLQDRQSFGTAGPWPAADPVDGVPHDVPGLRLVRVLGISSDVGLGESCQQWPGMRGARWWRLRG